ncbi:hypothetical protein [Burkholderia ubonensis]|uniref:hypothetical protein n=1 Tax=Burkholderia ubonensis TaxID=101571 RepID=UPI000AB74E82|nr:hypothetical protein [Burkholderia ubonensis]
MDENFFLKETENDGVWMTSPSGRNLRSICTKDTTLFSDTTDKEVDVPAKYVILKITTAATGYTLQKIYGHPNDNSNWNSVATPQPAVVVPTYRAKLILFDSSKGEADSLQYDINVTRDAWYYLGVDGNGSTWCRNMAFEPADPAKNKYLTEQIHFPSRANKNIHGYFLMESESQRGKAPRELHSESIDTANPYGLPISYRKDGAVANDVMFHIGGIYEAAAIRGHAKWLGGSEGCFAFVPQKSIRTSLREASLITLGNGFVSNRTWVSLTSVIEKYRDFDQKNRFIVEIEKRTKYYRDEIKSIVFLHSALHDVTNRFNSFYEENPGATP